MKQLYNHVCERFNSTQMLIQNFPVTAVILAGGLGTRIGGNKGLQPLHGKALIGWVLDAIRQDSAEVFINANDAKAGYAHFNCKVVEDLAPGLPGPLAGLESALNHASFDYVLTVPCDTPFLPSNLIPRLFEVLKSDQSEAAVVRVDGHRQPTIALYKKSVLSKLQLYLGSGKRKVNDWLDILQFSEVEFDHVNNFFNINSQEDLERAKLMPVHVSVRLEAE